MMARTLITRVELAEQRTSAKTTPPLTLATMYGYAATDDLPDDLRRIDAAMAAQLESGKPPSGLGAFYQIVAEAAARETLRADT